MRAFRNAVLAVLFGSLACVGEGSAQAREGSAGGTASLASLSAGGDDLLGARSGLDVDAVSLLAALDLLRQTAALPLLFSPSLIPDVGVSCRCPEFSAASALAHLLEGTGLDFRERDGQVIIGRSYEVGTGLLSGSDGASRDPGSAERLDERSSQWGAGRSGSGATAGRPAGLVLGSLRDEATGRPVAAAHVFIRGTTISSLTREDGAFELANVPPGSHTLTVQRIGYQPAQHRVVVDPAGTSRAEVVARPAVLALQGITATGLANPVEGVRSPITVARVNRIQMPVPAIGGVLENLQGRAAGVSVARHSGQPGADVSLMLRTPTSVTQRGGPLIVVDGAILGTGTTNIESLDVEKIEIVKGAAATSLYGSRAAAGVISIWTMRGKGVPAGETRFSARSEFGSSYTMRGAPQPTHHHYLMDAARSTYVDFDGNPVDRSRRVAPPAHLAFMDKPYPDGATPVEDAVYRPGAFQSQSLTAMRNGAATNFALMLNRQRDAGTLQNNAGYRRNSARLNLDHRFPRGVSLGVSAFHSRDWRDQVDLSFSDVLRTPADLDLRSTDENGQVVRVLGGPSPFENPLWTEGSRESDRDRTRSVGNLLGRWNPANWLAFAGNLSYDRQNAEYWTHVPQGTPLTLSGSLLSSGSVTLIRSVSDNWNGEAQVSLRHDFGELSARTTARGVWESASYALDTRYAKQVDPQSVARIDWEKTLLLSTRDEESRSIGYLWDTALDYGGRYIFTVLGRRDGSSLFGSNQTWHGYYRIAGAYRISEEPWFHFPRVDELKLSYARGTAGGRPPYGAQIGTWSLGAGAATRQLANPDLRPEHTLEQEVALQSILASRLGVSVVYAWQRTSDQLVELTLPPYAGNATRWENHGKVEGSTIEVALEANVQVTPGLQWSSTLVFDRSKAKIGDWPAGCTSPIWRMWCDGVGLYEIWSIGFLTDPRDLERHHGGAAAGRSGEFMVNDDGWLVWVGPGNDYRDGISKQLWGTSTQIGGATYRWGMPILDLDDGGAVRRVRRGDGSQTNLGVTQNLIFGNLALHAHLQAAFGGQIANQLYRPLRGTGRHPQMDQWGKPDGLKKPLAYYNALDADVGNAADLEPADYLKLRAISVQYRFGAAQLSRWGLGRFGMDSLSLGLMGRNLVSFHRCSCPDPEQGLNVNSRLQLLSAYDGYPPTRTLTAEIGITF